MDATAGSRHQPPVGADLGHPLVDAGLGGVIELEGVLRVPHDAVVGQHPVGHVPVGVLQPVERRLQRARMEPVHRVEDAVQVDDLVVAPVAERRPVALPGHLPVDAVVADPVGVVAVHRGGVQELGQERRGVAGEAVHQRQPVLEDVAPVALVREEPVAGRGSVADLEAVPGAARIAVAAAERERQVLVHEPGQGGVLRHGCLQLVELDDRVHSGGELFEPGGGGPVAGAHEPAHVGQAHTMGVERHAAAHAVVGHIGQVPDGCAPVGGLLEGVGVGDQACQLVVGLVDRGPCDRIGRAGAAQPPAQPRYRDVVAVDVGHDRPAHR